MYNQWSQIVPGRGTHVTSLPQGRELTNDDYYWSDIARTRLSNERLRHFRKLRVYKKKAFTHAEMAKAGYVWMDVEVKDVETVRGWASQCLDHGVYSTARYGTRYYFAYPEDLTMFKLRWG